MKTIKVIIILLFYFKAFALEVSERDLFIKLNKKHSLLKKDYLYLKSHDSQIIKITEDKKKKRIYLNALTIGETYIEAYLSRKNKIITMRVIVLPDAKKTKRKILYWDKELK